MSEIQEADREPALPRSRRRLIDRHTVLTRLTHWVNFVCVLILLMSGLQIFNAHPALYWGQAGADPDEAPFEIGASDSKDGRLAGFVRIGPSTFATTGFLGVSSNATGELDERGFPSWATLPSWRVLAMGR